MDFDLPPDDDPRRVAIRDWLAEHPKPSPQELRGAGLVVPHWPEPWGRNADPMEQLIIDEELATAGVRRPNNPIGIGWAGPTILHAGTDEQKQRFLPGLLTGQDMYCQMFSEPDAGSDLASLRTTAARDGDEYVINGSKIWTSGGHRAKYGILIARTDPAAPKHKGISYFVCPTDLDGLTMTPIVDMTRTHSFNQVFFDDVRIPVENRIGAEGDGWRLTKVTLSNERVSLSSAGSLWGSGPTATALLELLAAHNSGAPAENGPAGPFSRGSDVSAETSAFRHKAAKLHVEAEVLRLNRRRTLSARLHGETPGPEASIQKMMGDEHGQHVMALAKDAAGPAGMLAGSGPAGEIPKHMRTGIGAAAGHERQFPNVDPIWHYGYLFSPASTIGGGTFAIQRNIVGEHVLRLPREPS